MQALRRFEHMSSISIKGAARIEDLAILAVELEEEAGAWKVSSSDLYSLYAFVIIVRAIWPVLRASRVWHH